MDRIMKVFAFARNFQKTMHEVQECADKHCAKEKEALRKMHQVKMKKCLKSKKNANLYECSTQLAMDKEFLQKRAQSKACVQKHCTKHIEEGLGKYMKMKKAKTKKMIKSKKVKKAKKTKRS